MLTLEKRTPIWGKIQLILTLIILIFGIWTWGIVLHSLNSKTVCMKIPMREYTTQNAPAKCMDLWNEGQL